MTSEETTRERDAALVEQDAPICRAEIRRALKVADYTARKILDGRRYMRPSEVRRALEQLRAG